MNANNLSDELDRSLKERGHTTEQYGSRLLVTTKDKTRMLVHVTSVNEIPPADDPVAFVYSAVVAWANKHENFDVNRVGANEFSLQAVEKDKNGKLWPVGEERIITISEKQLEDFAKEGQ